VKVDFHPSVRLDISRILAYYNCVNDRLGDEFWEELNSFFDLAAANPQRFHFYQRKQRRANLRRFPYHFLFHEVPGGIRITVVRHHKQRPEYGSRRR
jgi:hypothetical protein